MAAERDELREYADAVISLLLAASCVLVLLGGLAILIVTLLTNSAWALLVVAATVFSILTGVNASLDRIQNAARQRMLYSFHTTAVAWLKILVVIVCFTLFGEGPGTALIAYSIAVLPILLSQFWFLSSVLPIQRFSVSAVIQSGWFSKVLVYAAPYAVWGVFLWVQQSSPRWALAQFTGTAEVGLFAVLMQIGYAPVVALTGFATTLLTPILFEMAGEAKSNKQISDVTKFSKRLAFSALLTTLLFVLICAIFHSAIFKVLVSEEYHHVSFYLPVVVAAGGIYAIGQVYANRILAIMMSKALMPATILSAIAGSVAAYIGAYYWFLQGAVYSLLVYSVSYLVLLLPLAMKESVARQEGLT